MKKSELRQIIGEEIQQLIEDQKQEKWHKELFNSILALDKYISDAEELAEAGDRKKFVSILKKYDINIEGSPDIKDILNSDRVVTQWDGAKLSNELEQKFHINLDKLIKQYKIK